MLKIIGVELALQDQHPTEGPVNCELQMFSCDLRIPDHPQVSGIHSYARRNLVVTIHTSHGDRQMTLPLDTVNRDMEIHRANP
jgi:hypothetical protein